MLGKSLHSKILKMLIAFSLVALPLLGSISRVSAQGTGLTDEGTFVVDLTGEEITWENDWTVDEASIVQNADFESFSLSADDGLLYVSYFIATGDPADALETFLGGFTSALGAIENVDSDDLDGGAYSLDTVEGDDDLILTFFSTIAEVDELFRIVTAVSPSESISDAVDLTKSTVEFDGDDAFEEVESVSDSRVRLAETSDGNEDDAETPEAFDETPEADDETPEADDETPEADDETPEVDVETPEVDDETPEDDGNENSGETSYTFEINDVVVEWGEPWVSEESLNYVEDDYESVGFIGNTGIQSISYLPTGVDLDEARDSFLEGFASDEVSLQEIDRGAYDNVSYSLDLAEIGGDLWGLFTVYIDDGEYVLSYATLAPADDLGEALDLAKDTITIDGQPIYNGVTGAGLQDLIDANVDSFSPTDTVQGGADDDRTTPEDDDSGSSSDETVYLETVRESFDTLRESETRFDELFGSGDLSDAEIEELTGILDLWSSAPGEAEDLDVPEGLEDLHKIYTEYTEAIGDAGVNFVAGLSADPDSAEQGESLDKYASDRINADEYATMLEDLLSDAGV